MGNSYPKFNFQDNMRTIPQKALTSEALSRGLVVLKLDVTNGEYTGITAYPYKYLPALYTSSEKTSYGKEGIVLMKGTIVSLVTNQTSIAAGGIPVPTSSGTIPQYIDAISGDIISAPIDWEFFGYDESIGALIVPCNGGAGTQIPYSATDTELGLWNTSSDDPLTIGANIPHGIVIEDVYQDIRGAYLNYQTHDAYSALLSGRFDIPFVDTSKLENPFIAGANEQADVIDDTEASIYNKVWKSYAYCYFDGSAYEGRSGAPLQSDRYGKFKVQSSSVTANKTIQTVGHVMYTDCRFPKELTSVIQTYPNTTLNGVNTAGLPVDLYLFVKAILTADGQTADAKHCLAAVQDGLAGYVRVQLNVK